MRVRELSADERALEARIRAFKLRLYVLGVFMLMGLAVTAWESGVERAEERAAADKQVELLRAQLRDAKAACHDMLEAK